MVDDGFDTFEKKTVKAVFSIMALAVFVILFFLGLFTWGFIELVQWLTSK